MYQHTKLTNNNSNLIQKFNSKSLADLVGTISGVSILKTGTNIVKPIINGVYGARVLIVQDGSKLQDHEWGDDHAPSIDVNNIDRLQLIKGAMGLQYGNAIGGIIKISPIEFIPKDTLFGGIFGSYHDNGKLNSSSLRLNKIKEKSVLIKLFYFLFCNFETTCRSGLASEDRDAILLRPVSEKTRCRMRSSTRRSDDGPQLRVLVRAGLTTPR